MDISAVLAAFAGKQWVLLVALLVGGLVAAAKQGWLSTWLADKLPKPALPYLATALSMLGVAASEVIGGQSLNRALIDGIQAGMLAVFGHEAIIESLRKGKEIIPEKKVSPADLPKGPPANDITKAAA